MSIIIQSGGYMLGVMNSLGRLGKSLSKKAVTDLAVPFAKDVLPGFVINIASNTALNVNLNKFVKRKGGK